MSDGCSNVKWQTSDHGRNWICEDYVMLGRGVLLRTAPNVRDTFGTLKSGISQFGFWGNIALHSRSFVAYRSPRNDCCVSAQDIENCGAQCAYKPGIHLSKYIQVFGIIKSR